MRAVKEPGGNFAVRVWGRHGMAIMFGLAGLAAACGVQADSKDGIFPRAEQVGGDVFPKGLNKGDRFPTDFDVYDESGKKVDFGKLLSGKKNVVAFFISAAPVSIAEVKRLEDFARNNAPGVQIIPVNADTVGTALEGGPSKAIPATIQTARLVKKENGYASPVYVAPNDALNPKGLSNRIGFRGLPTFFVLRGNVVEKVFVGPQQWKKGDI